jgi:hypothetical protein
VASSRGRGDGWPDLRLDQLWDLFIEWLEREAREGRAADVVIPALGPDVGHGKRLADLTAAEIAALKARATTLQRDTRSLDKLWHRTKLAQAHARHRRES